MARVVVGAIVAGLLLAACGQDPAPTAPGTDATPGPTPAAIPAPPPAPIVVTIDRTGGTAHVGYPLRVSAAALGRTAIAGLELWAGGERVATTANPVPSRPGASARWEWTPEQAGETILVARGFDETGRSAQSAPLRVRVVEAPPRTWRLEQVASAEGETLDEVVARAGGDPALARAWNEALPQGPLAAGTVVEVPVPDPVAPPPSAFRDRAAFTFARAALAVSAGLIVPDGLATPDLAVTVSDCTISATASGGTDATTGFSFSVLPPVGQAFVTLPPVAPSESAGASTSFAALGGANYVSVAAYSPEATAPSAIVPVAVPEDCGASGWEGSARLDGGTLVAPGSPDRAYLYLRVGEGDWQRVPALAGTFVEPAGGTLDFGPVLPDIVGRDLRLEAWGWTSGALSKLGDGTYDAPGQVLYSGAWNSPSSVPAGFGTSLDVVVQAGGGEMPEVLARESTLDIPGPTSQSAKRTFRWSTTLPGVTHLVWQILPYPLSGSSSLTPPFLLDTGTLNVTGLSTGTFKIDLKPYLTGEAPGVTSATQWTGEQVVGPLVEAAFDPGATPAPADVAINPNGIWLPGATPVPSTVPGSPPDIGQAVVDDLAFLAPPPDALFVRVIPFSGTTPAGTPSNQVSFDVVEPDEPIYLDTSPPPPTPTYTDAHTTKVVFFAPTGSNASYFSCVRVVKGGFNKVPWGNWSNGTTHCKPKDDDGWSLADAFDAFVEWVGTAWDYISEGYDWIQNKVIDAVLAFVPCEQIADEVADDGKSVCKAIAKTALQAVMISFGIPPEIPDWEATIAVAKGDLRTYILENAKLLPGVAEACGSANAANTVDGDFPTCEAVIDKAIDTAIDEIGQRRSEAAAAQAGVFVPPGVTVEPHPKGMAQPPHFEVTVTRTGTPLPAGTTCSLTGRMESVLPGWTWKEYQWTNGKETVVTKSGTVTGKPFLDATQTIAGLDPGESASYELWLSTRNVWFEPDGIADHYAQQYAEWNGQHNHAWVLVQPGATVTAKISGNCSPPGQLQTVLKGNAWD